MQTKALDEKLNLDEVSAAFEEWRKTNVGGHPIPEALWQLVRRLKISYRVKDICSSLRINSQQFKTNVLSSSQSSPTTTRGKKKSPQVIELSAEALKKPVTQDLNLVPIADQTTIELAREDGSRLTLSKLTAQQFKETLTLFLGK